MIPGLNIGYYAENLSAKTKVYGSTFLNGVQLFSFVQMCILVLFFVIISVLKWRKVSPQDKSKTYVSLIQNSMILFFGSQ